MVGEKKECKGKDVDQGQKDSLEDCAKACIGKASMFIFGTNDFGVDRCDGESCQCFCETSANADGTCNMVENKGYRLYKLRSLGKYQPYHRT